MALKAVLPVLLGALYSLFPVVSPVSVQTGWRPITRLESVSPASTLSFQSHIPSPHDECTLYKAIFEHDSYHQYIQYKTQIPDLKEFTLCTWHKFYNHSMDQPIFSYSQHDRQREILSWVANSDSASYYMFAVGGHTLYRLNYPVRLNKWYHSCQSWNSRTGEWQIWVNSERIGRGFHNLLVGKTIKGGGLAISGQEQRQYSNQYFDGYKTRGLLGEVTLVQLYKAALTAGKAYTNHKHHHVHHFHHEGKEGEDDLPYSPAGATPAPAPGGEENQATEFPFLRNGQLIPTLPVQQLSAFRAQEDALKNQEAALNSPLNILSSDAFLPNNPNVYSLQSIRLFKREPNKGPSRRNRQKKSYETVEAEDKLKESEEIEDAEKLVKEISRIKRDIMKTKTKTTGAVQKESTIQKRQTESEEDEKNQKKRTVGEQYPFGLIPGVDLSGLFQGDGYVLGGGGERYNEEDDRAVRPQSHESQSMAQMEPAEWEVRSIMALCSGCSEDPFRKANIISWRETPKKLYSGALYVPAISECHRF